MRVYMRIYHFPTCVAQAHHWGTQGFSHPIVSFQPHTGVVDQNEGKLQHPS